MFLTKFFGPCKNNDREPINKNPSGPGILTDSILFLLCSNLNIMINIEIAVRETKTKYHIFDSFDSLTCEQILVG